MRQADDLCHSYEIAEGETMPAGTPFRLGALLNINVNKFFNFIREKLALGIKAVFQSWIMPRLIKDLKAKDILRLTGDSEYLKKFYELAVEGWYRRNLIMIGPHPPEYAFWLKEQKLKEFQKNSNSLAKITKEVFEDFKPRIKVVIVGESINLAADMETLGNFIGMESDPVRRTALIEIAMAKKGIDVSMLPKTPMGGLGVASPVPKEREMPLVPKEARIAKEVGEEEI